MKKKLTITLVIIFILLISLFLIINLLNKPKYQITIHSDIPLIHQYTDLSFNKLYKNNYGEDIYLNSKEKEYEQYNHYVNESSSIILKKFNVTEDNINKVLNNEEFKKYLNTNSLNTKQDNYMIFNFTDDGKGNKKPNFEYFQNPDDKDFNLKTTFTNRIYIISNTAVFELGFVDSDDIYFELVSQIKNNDFDQLNKYLNLFPN